MTSGRAYWVFNSLLLVSCLLDFATTRYALHHQYQEANPWAPLEFSSMAMTTVVIFFIGSALFYFSRRVLAKLDEPVPENRTMACFMRALNKSLLAGAAFGCAPLPLVILVLKFIAGMDNLLLLMYDENVGSAVRQYFLTLSTAEFFIAEMIFLGSIMYVITYIWMLRRWLQKGSLLHEGYPR